MQVLENEKLILASSDDANELIKNDHVFNLFTAVRCTHILYAAHEMKLFPILDKQSMTLPEISNVLKIQERSAQALLSMCASLNLIKIEDGKYILTEVSKHYLLPKSPYYFGPFIDMAIHNPEVLSYDKFKKALSSNSSQVYDEQELFEINEENAKKAEMFTRAMHSKSVTAASIWPKIINLSKYNTLLDIGGGSGVHAIEAAKAWPSLQAIIYDRPLVCKISKEYIKNAHLQNRIKTEIGNMWKEPFPHADLHFYCDVFHDWPTDKCEFLLNKSYKSLPINGRVIIHELLFNEKKSGPLSTAIYNMIMLLWTQGQQYSTKEMVQMLEQTGFKDIQILSTGFGNWSIVTGVK